MIQWLIWWLPRLSWLTQPVTQWLTLTDSDSQTDCQNSCRNVVVETASATIDRINWRHEMNWWNLNLWLKLIEPIRSIQFQCLKLNALTTVNNNINYITHFNLSDCETEWVSVQAYECKQSQSHQTGREGGSESTTKRQIQLIKYSQENHYLLTVTS